MNDLIRPALYESFHRIWPVAVPAGLPAPPDDFEAAIAGHRALGRGRPDLRERRLPGQGPSPAPARPRRPARRLLGRRLRHGHGLQLQHPPPRRRGPRRRRRTPGSSAAARPTKTWSARRSDSELERAIALSRCELGRPRSFPVAHSGLIQIGPDSMYGERESLSVVTIERCRIGCELERGRPGLVRSWSSPRSWPWRSRPAGRGASPGARPRVVRPGAADADGALERDRLPGPDRPGQKAVPVPREVPQEPARRRDLHRDPRPVRDRARSCGSATTRRPAKYAEPLVDKLTAAAQTVRDPSPSGSPVRGRADRDPAKSRITRSPGSGKPGRTPCRSLVEALEPPGLTPEDRALLVRNMGRLDRSAVPPLLAVLDSPDPQPGGRRRHGPGPDRRSRAVPFLTYPAVGRRGSAGGPQAPRRRRSAD